MNDTEPYLVVLDADRTLVDTDVILNAFMRHMHRRYALDVRDVCNAELESRETGVVFSPLEYILQQDPQFGKTSEERRASRERILQEMVLELSDSERVRLPRVTELLDMLREDNMPHMILTHGDDVWQRLKLELADLDRIPYVITPEPHKATVLRDWWSEDLGAFAVQMSETRRLFREVILADDRMRNLTDLPKHVFGLHDVEAGAAALSYPPSVQRVIGVQGVIEQYRRIVKHK